MKNSLKKSHMHEHNKTTTVLPRLNERKQIISPFKPAERPHKLSERRRLFFDGLNWKSIEGEIQTKLSVAFDHAKFFFILSTPIDDVSGICLRDFLRFNDERDE